MNYYKSYEGSISFTDNIYKCYLCKERPTFITKDFYDRHHERFHLTKRYEKIARRNLNTSSSNINGVYSDKYMQTNTKSPHDTLKASGSYDFDAIHQLIAKQETDINLQHQQLSNIIATYQNNNIYPERLSNLLEKKEKLVLVITELQKLKEQLELSKQLENLAGDIKHKENEIYLLENDKTVLQQDIQKIYSNKQENVVVEKSNDNEMQILFESFKSYFQGNTINHHGEVDRYCNDKKINHLADKMKVLEDEVEGLKQDKHQCKQQMKEYRPTESIDSLKLLVRKMKEDKINDSKNIEELKTKISLDEKQIEEQRMKYKHLIKELHQSKDLIGSLNSKIDIIESEKASLLETSLSNKTTWCFSECSDSKSNAKKEVEFKNVIIEKEEQLYQCERLIKEFTMQLNNTEEFDEISDLKHEIEAITKERERFNDEIETAIREIEKLQKNELTIPACIKCEINIRKYEKENVEVCKKFKANELKMSQLQSDLEKANEYLETARGEANQATNMISKFDFQNKEIEEDMKKLVKENGKEKEKTLKLAVKLKEYQSERVEQKQKNKSLREENKKLKEVSNDSDDMKVLEEKCQSLESLLESRIDLDKKGKKENKLVLELLENENEILKKQVKHLEEASFEGSEECNSLKDQLVEMKKKLCEKATLENQLSKAENDKVGEELIRARTEIKNLRMSLIEAKETTDGEKQKLSSNQEELTKLKNELELKNEESNQHFKRIKELQSTILKKDNTILSKDLLLQEADEKITELETKVQVNKEMVDSEKETGYNIVQDETIKEANLKISQLNEQVSVMTSARTTQVIGMEKKMKVIEIEMSTTQSKLEDRDITIAELEEQCIMFKKQLRSKNNEVEKQNENMIEIKILLKKVEEEKFAEEQLSTRTQKKLESKISKLKDYCGQLFDENNILKTLQEEKESNRVSEDECVNSDDDNKKATDSDEVNGDEKPVEYANVIVDANGLVNVKADAKCVSEELTTNNVNDDVDSDWDDDDVINDDDALFDNDDDPMNSIVDISCDKQPLIKLRSTNRNETLNVDGDTVDDTSIGSYDNEIAQEPVVDINAISQVAKQTDNLSPDVQGSLHQSVTTTNTSGLELPILTDDDDNDYDDVSDDESVNFDEDIDDLLNGLNEIDTKRSYTPSWS